jgi:hypothetical protein
MGPYDSAKLRTEGFMRVPTTDTVAPNTNNDMNEPYVNPSWAFIQELDRPDDYFGDEPDAGRWTELITLFNKEDMPNEGKRWRRGNYSNHVWAELTGCKICCPIYTFPFWHNSNLVLRYARGGCFNIFIAAEENKELNTWIST